MTPLIDRTGLRFGRLVVISRVGNVPDGHVTWLCRCDCGKETTVRSNHLQGGRIRSCGCFAVDQKKINGGVNRLPNGEASFNAIVRHYVKSAKKRGLAFELTEDQIRAIIGLKCHYCGAEPAQVINCKTYVGTYLYNGIDRLDNLQGYIANNVVPCCARCNFAKGTMGRTEFLDWIKRVYAFNFGGQHG